MLEEQSVFRKALRQRSPEFRKLEEAHHHLEWELNELIRRKTLTPQEVLHKKQIQVKKLHTKDRMEAIVRNYMKQHAVHS